MFKLLGLGGSPCRYRYNPRMSDATAKGVGHWRPVHEGEEHVGNTTRLGRAHLFEW